MKKALTLLMALTLVLGMMTFTVGAAGTPINLLTKEELAYPTDGSNWQWNDDGSLTAKNKEVFDNALMTDYYLAPGQNHYVEITGTLNDGNVFGLVLCDGDKGYENKLGAGWTALSVNAADTKLNMFTVGSAWDIAKDGPVLFLSDAIAVGKEVTIGLAISADNTVTVYLNGVRGTEIRNTNFAGACLGIFTCFTDVTVTSLTASHTLPGESAELRFVSTQNLLADGVLKYQSAADASYTMTDGKLVCGNAAVGDAAYMSEVYIPAGKHYYIEMTGTATAGSWGFLTSELASSAEGVPALTNCVITMLNVAGWINSFPLGETAVTPGPTYTERRDDIGADKASTVGLEILADGTFIYTVNGETFAVRRDTNWAGGYVGVFTCVSDAVISAFAVSEVDDSVPVDPDPSLSPDTADSRLRVGVGMIGVSLTAVAIVLTKKKYFGLS